MGSMSVQMQTHCDKCGGRGTVIQDHKLQWIEEKCQHCNGKKVVVENKQMEAVIERGMFNEDEILYPKQADQFPNYNSGDLVFILKQNPHPTFERIEIGRAHV